ncbi:hypothetical protein DPMN_136201 [Dreissena polymorpha]|uniref:Uncharacterized protein n=1 Tax=Dreissena polymorpha TaxID=45954 RepID=A0A9D4G2B1_DREPO|nr:hypothetical protein DPMN_136201 [Dreissena polymorpha]
MFYQPQFLFCLKYGFPRNIFRINLARDSVSQCLVGDTIFPSPPCAETIYVSLHHSKT